MLIGEMTWETNETWDVLVNDAGHYHDFMSILRTSPDDFSAAQNVRAYVTEWFDLAGNFGGDGGITERSELAEIDWLTIVEGNKE
jgi:hypothetical protein